MYWLPGQKFQNIMGQTDFIARFARGNNSILLNYKMELFSFTIKLMWQHLTYCGCAWTSIFICLAYHSTWCRTGYLVAQRVALGLHFPTCSREYRRSGTEVDQWGQDPSSVNKLWWQLQLLASDHSS